MTRGNTNAPSKHSCKMSFVGASSKPFLTPGLWRFVNRTTSPTRPLLLFWHDD